MNDASTFTNSPKGGEVVSFECRALTSWWGDVDASFTIVTIFSISHPKIPFTSTLQGIQDPVQQRVSTMVAVPSAFG